MGGLGLREDYVRGMEDSLELALFKIRNAKTAEECRNKIEYLLSLVKEQKFEYLKWLLKDLR